MNRVPMRPRGPRSPRARHEDLLAGLLLAACCASPACSEASPEPGAVREGEAAAGRPEADHGAQDEVIVLTPASLRANDIHVEIATRQELRPTFRAPAHVAYDQEGMAHVGSLVTGRVAELRVKLGDEVEKGDVLLVIESPELAEAQSEYLQRRSLAQTSALPIELAQDAYERAKGLYDQTQGIPLAEVQKREAEYHATQAALQAARTAEQAAENKLHVLGMNQKAVQRLGESGEIDPHFTVRAPIGGQVIEREVTLGELVGPEREALMVLADMSRLWVLADVHETRVGAPARVLLGFDQEHWCTGVVAFISPALDTRTRSAHVRIDVTDRHPDLRPGVFAQVEIESAPDAHTPPQAVVAVPESALQTVEGRSVVFVPVAGRAGAFSQRVLRLGPQAGGQVSVLSGLEAGESYVSRGSFVLKAELTKGSGGQEH